MGITQVKCVKMLFQLSVNCFDGKYTVLSMYAACRLLYILTTVHDTFFFKLFLSSTYTGYIRKSFGGEKVLIENMFGMGEDFYLRA